MVDIFLEIFIPLGPWFMVLLATIVGLYCLVLNFGDTLNRVVFLLATLGAIYFTSIGLMLIPLDVGWFDTLTYLLVGSISFIRPLQLIANILLLKPAWWRRSQGWVIKISAGVSFVLPVIVLIDGLFQTGLYMTGLAETYQGGFVTPHDLIPGQFFWVLNLLNETPLYLVSIGLALYIIFWEGKNTRLLRRWLAWLILASLSLFLAARFIPAIPIMEQAGFILLTLIGAVIHLGAIFIYLFARRPFKNGSGLQTRLLLVVLTTTIPILIAVALLSLSSVVAAVGGMVVGIIMLVGLTWLTLHFSLSPIKTLTQTTAAIAAGNLNRIAPVEGNNEFGELARSFNEMTHQLRSLIGDLENRVRDRTRELERRATYQETSSLVGQHATSILDQDALMKEVVDLIQAGFGFYFVGIWLLNDAQNQLVLQAGAIPSGEAISSYSQNLAPAEIQPAVVNVCQSHTYQLVTDINEIPAYIPDDMSVESYAQLALPLRQSGETIGVLDIYSADLSGFSQDDIIVFQSLADKVAIALQNARLYKAEQNRRRLSEALEATGREIASNLDLYKTPERILEQLALVVRYARGSLMLQEGAVLKITAQRGFPEDYRLESLEVPIRDGDVYRQVVETTRPLLVDDVTKLSHWQQIDWLPLHLSWMGIPLIAKGGVIGMISMTRPEQNGFNQQDARLASVFAGQAAIALENARLYEKIVVLNEGLEQTVTERTDALNKAYQNLERLDKTKSDFINVVAHELRTPITVIKGYAQVIKRSQETETETAQANHENEEDTLTFLDGILTGVDRLQEVVDSMLDLTRIEQNAFRIFHEETALIDILDQVKHYFDTTLQERSLAFDAEGLDDLPLIYGDPDLLFKVFYHLVMNAIKYVPDGGQITVCGRILNQTDDNPIVEVIVSDTGIGIDPAHHELIFEKFYQTGPMAVHSSGRTKFKGGGAGLGLAIAQGIVQAHKGKIWVESRGHDEDALPGSRFHVQLPLNGVSD